jgi:phosphatidylinositol alpha-1,6-mannosyltransferase
MIVGRMWAEERGKGHDQLLECWPAVVHELPEAELWIIGDGNDRPQLEARARSLGIESSVLFLGRVSDQELSQRYRTASVFAMPSRQEGFGLVYSEAMLHGLPCIASTLDAGAEIVQEGKTGLLVPYDDPAALADAILSILRNPARARELGQAAKRRARERFGYERFRDGLLEALELA